MEVYKGKYVELEQDNIEQNFNNEQEEKDKIIPNNENEGFTSKKYNLTKRNNPKSNFGKSSQTNPFDLGYPKSDLAFGLQQPS
ncbi:hypothetical protein C1645_837240 [Glomus cerebriforme]|uniref:Uncharacterized protein n=1 Tax=Glomus cerebriforme TaxID=658196 RepID=A0A397S4H5_9GLOM|nr:hypothetical protein C1645_837240 [Glomus cerebriforme]